MEKPSSATRPASEESVERQRQDYWLVALTLVMIGLCVPLATAFPHRPKGGGFSKFEAFGYALALLFPIAMTAAAVFEALAWVVRKGSTQRGRSRWFGLLLVAFTSSAPGYLLVFVIMLALGYLRR